MMYFDYYISDCNHYLDEPPSGASKLVRLSESERIYIRVPKPNTEYDETKAEESAFYETLTDGSFSNSISSYTCVDFDSASRKHESSSSHYHTLEKVNYQEANVCLFNEVKQLNNSSKNYNGFVAWTFDEEENYEGDDTNDLVKGLSAVGTSFGHFVIA